MYKLSPSDFAYLYEECKLCYVLKIKYGISRPSSVMPAVFTAINTRVQGSLVGKKLNELSSELPDGEVVKQEGFVDSKEIPGTSVFVKGKYDLLVKNSDNTYTVVDLKISSPNVDKIEKYKTQLYSYKFALENPKNDDPIKVTRLGLLIFYPDGVSFEDEQANVNFPPKWLEIPIDDNGFFEFMKSVDELLKGPLPKESVNCKWCQYRHLGEDLSHTTENDASIPF